MEEFKEKFRLIFIPFFLVSTGLIFIYCFLNWLIIYKFEIISTNNEIINFVLPIFLSLSLTFFILLPRIKLLKWEKEDGYIPIFVVSTLLLFASAIFFQLYTETISYQLIKLDSISQINKFKSKYYSINKLNIIKKTGGIYRYQEQTGKYGDKLEFNIKVVNPIYERNDSNLNNYYPIAWFGITFHDYIDPRFKSNVEIERFRDAFNEKSMLDLEWYDYNDYLYLERVLNSSNYNEFVKAIKLTHLYNPLKPPIFVIPIKTPFKDRNVTLINIALGAYFIYQIMILLIIIRVPFDRKKHRAFTQKRILFNFEGIIHIYKSLIGMKQMYSSFSIIIVNIIVFLLFTIVNLHNDLPDTELFIKWGGNIRSLTADGQYWRLITYSFLHGNIAHLLVNMMTLVQVGLFIEGIVGYKKFLLTYFISGIIAGIASISWHDSVVSVGASGAIFGLYGLFLSLLTMRVFPSFIRFPFLLFTLIFIVFNLLVGISGTIDNAAHIGGLLSGIVLGYIMFFNKNNRDKLMRVD